MATKLHNREGYYSQNVECSLEVILINSYLSQIPWLHIHRLISTQLPSFVAFTGHKFRISITKWIIQINTGMGSNISKKENGEQ